MTMDFSAEKLMAIARNYWPADKVPSSRPEPSPEQARLSALWDEKLRNRDTWNAFLRELRQDLPGYTIGSGIVPSEGSLRCFAYADEGCPPPTFRFVLVGCISILAPIYTVFGVEYDFVGGKRHHPRLSFEPLPPKMRAPADLMARRIESAFNVRPLPREVAETPIPLFVHWREPPYTTLFHAFFDSQPDNVF